MSRPELNQEVVISERTSSFGGPRYNFGYFVTKVTPSGQVTVVKQTPNGLSPTHTRKFNSDGREIRTGTYNMEGVLKLDVAEVRASEARRAALNDAAALLNAVKLERHAEGSWGKEGLVARLEILKTQLAAAEAAINAIA